MSDDDVGLDGLLNYSGNELLAWLDGVQDGRRSQPAGLNWLLLAHATADRARSEGTSVDESRSLAKAAMTIYEKILSADKDDSHVLAAMRLRAFMINRHGTREGDSAFDPQIVINWFISTVSITAQEAVRRAAWCRDAIVDNRNSANDVQLLKVMHELRNIKDRLSVLELMGEHAEPWLDDNLRHWISLRRRLP